MRPPCKTEGCEQPRRPKTCYCATHYAEAKDRTDTYLDNYIQSRKTRCAACGWNTHPRGLDFHHVNPATKKFALSAHPRGRLREIQLELAKCVLLCANCHRLTHAGLVDPTRLPRAWYDPKKHHTAA